MTRGYTPGFLGSNYKPRLKISSCADTKGARLHTLGCFTTSKMLNRDDKRETIPAYMFGFIEIPLKLKVICEPGACDVDFSINENCL